MDIYHVRHIMYVTLDISWPHLVEPYSYSNLTIYLKAFRLERHSAMITILSPSVGILIRIPIGLLSDKTKAKIPRITYHLIANIIVGTVWFVCIFWSNHLFILIILAIAVNICSAVTWTILPVILSEEYGMKNFGKNFSYMVLPACLVGLISQQIFAVFYRAATEQEHSHYCYGVHCFRWSFLLIAIFSVISAILNLLLCRRKLKQMAKLTSATRSDMSKVA